MVRTVEPSALLRDAAEVLGDVKNDVVIVGAAAIEVALHGVPASITPTRDVDLVVAAHDVDRVVQQLEAAELIPSELDYERGFTWVRDELKVQLIRGFHPFPPGRSAGLPVNPTADAARHAAHREEVAFAAEPETPRLWVATPACLVALKQNAFGRTRPPDHEVVRRDFHDVYLLVDQVPDRVLAAYGIADGGVRQGVREAVAVLCDERGDPLRLAAREMVGLGEARNQRDAEAEILLSMRAFGERL
jgi:hypothetical protein